MPLLVFFSVLYLVYLIHTSDGADNALQALLLSKHQEQQDSFQFFSQIVSLFSTFLSNWYK